MGDFAVTEEEKRKYARALVLLHATEVGYLTIHELAEDELGRDISDDDAEDVLDLIHSANVQVSW